MNQVVGEINRITSQIADLNQNIRRATAGGTNPNDLLDNRDSLLKELSEQVQMNVRYQDDDSVLVELDGRLVVTAAGNVDLRVNTADGDRLDVVYDDDGAALMSPAVASIRCFQPTMIFCRRSSPR